jgi:hypothetical protein
MKRGKAAAKYRERRWPSLPGNGSDLWRGKNSVRTSEPFVRKHSPSVYEELLSCDRSRNY